MAANKHRTFIDRIVEEETINSEQQEVIDHFTSYTPASPIEWILKAGFTPQIVSEALDTLIHHSVTEGGIIFSHNHNGVYESANINIQSHFLREDNPHNVTKSQIGLSLVENTLQIPLSQKGTPRGVAELGADGKVPSSQLPSYVDDVEEYADLTAFPITGESGKIYIDLDTNLTYRWSGTVYVMISSSLTLGEVSTTAYRGDRGKIAYEHTFIDHNFEPANPSLGQHLYRYNNPHNVTKGQIGLSEVLNEVQIPLSQKGAPDGVAELDQNGLVPSSQLPAYISIIAEYMTRTLFPEVGENEIIYISLDDNKQWRWSGTGYREISSSLALGETSGSAYRGDRGKVAYDHSQSIHANPDAQKNSDITKSEIEAVFTGSVTTHTHPLQQLDGNVFRMQQRRDSSDQWLFLNPVLAIGELGLEIDTGDFKMGDGQTPWRDLPHWTDLLTIDGGDST